MSCTGARLTELAKKVAAVLSHAADPAARVTVERVYAPDWLDPNLWLENNANLEARFAGRRVYVFGAAEEQEGPADRGHDFNNYGISVVVIERYDGAEPDVPIAWMDERIAWVEQEIYDRLGNETDVELETDLGDNVYAISQEWNSVYSPDLLRRHKLFRSEVTIFFQRADER